MHDAYNGLTGGVIERLKILIATSHRYRLVNELTGGNWALERLRRCIACDIDFWLAAYHR